VESKSEENTATWKLIMLQIGYRNCYIFRTYHFKTGYADRSFWI